MKFYVSLILSSFVLFAGCSKPSPEEYFARATAARDSSNFTTAIQEYEALIKDHPQSVQAEEALFHIASIRNDNLHDFPSAVQTYKQYVEKYPQGKHLPIALFLTGYLYNNELHDLNASKAAYEQFLAAYPDHEMVPSAKFELQNLGKKPEELLPAMQQSAQQTAAQTPKPKPTKKK